MLSTYKLRIALLLILHLVSRRSACCQDTNELIESQSPANSSHGAEEWSYEDPDSWPLQFSTCAGNRQSPVALGRGSTWYKLKPLKFKHYDELLEQPVIVTNNGHTVDMKIPRTTEGHRPTIGGATLSGGYEAMSLHFHWGERGAPGAEHSIYGMRHDMEMHIVHKKVTYESMSEAAQHDDGITVLAVMFSVQERNTNVSSGLTQLFNVLPRLVEDQSNATLRRPLTLRKFINNLYTDLYFTYKGSLTTPPCSQAVIWHVFPKPLPITSAQIKGFFKLKNMDGDPLLNNFRPIQSTNRRKVLVRFPLFLSL